ncbi:nuclear transport factor 2-like [Lycium ferocissimum]|uniref:nuclear transport factor 2-like n=1 Tax=Lycium ferocissimum TaxID=112874 RepID=UPI0028164B57|nr:nuclear transport factor 2-like [Lycium ferocissimum]
MATQTNQHSAETVALSFVDQYYRILHRLIDQSYRFYKQNSALSWPQPDGEIKYVTTSEGINEFIVSCHFKNNKVEATTIDSQLSAAGGVLVVVTASLIRQDDSRKTFSQTFFLAPQEKGYYVLNDIFRFVGVQESSLVVEEQVDENALVSPMVLHPEPATESKAGYNVEAHGKEVYEIIPVVENAAPKLSYASMIKKSRSSRPTNTPYRIVRIVGDAGLPSAPKKLQANVGLAKALAPNSSGVLKVAAPSINVAPDNFNEDIQCKSIYIGGLPTNTAKRDLHDVVKQFRPVHTHDVQLKTYEVYQDGYCYGFVHFQDAISAQNAINTHHIIVKGREAYIKFKELTKVPTYCFGRTKSPSGVFRNSKHYMSGFESRSWSQSSDRQRGEGYLQQNYRKRDHRGGANTTIISIVTLL